jgi:hypothetical protein
MSCTLLIYRHDPYMNPPSGSFSACKHDFQLASSMGYDPLRDHEPHHVWIYLLRVVLPRDISIVRHIRRPVFGNKFQTSELRLRR